MAKKEKNLAKKGKGLWEEFKAFINKGNALMLAVGVVIGGAFSAIVGGVVGILTSFINWVMPVDFGNLIVVLPGIYANQNGLEGVGQSFFSDQFDAMAAKLGEGGSDTLNANYTLVGNRWVANGAAYINFGVLINAVISFLIIAIILFAIVKIITVVASKKAEIDAKLLEEYYKKHPEERPVEPEPGVPEPTEKELLTQIRDLLKEQNKAKSKKE